MEEANGLSELPQGWVWTQLGDVCLKPQYGWTTSAATEGKLHLLRTTDITSGNIDWDTVPFCKKEPLEKEKYLLRDRDIVVSRAGSVGYSHLVRTPKEAVFASYLIRFKPLIDERYVAFFLKSPLYWEAISEKSIGIAIPNVNATKLSQVWFPLSPLPEQQRIAAKIEELFTQLDAGVAALEQIKVQLRRYRQAVLKAAAEGDLTREWREAHRGGLEPALVLLERSLEERRTRWEIEQLAKMRAKGKMPKDDRWKAKYKEPIPPDASESRELPLGWVRATLDQLSYHVTSGSRGWAKYYADTGALFIRVGNFNRLDTAIDLREPVFVNAPSGPEADRTRLQVGDLLITITADVGMVGIADEHVLQWGEGYINQHVGLVRLGLPEIVVFAAYVCASDYIQGQIRNRQYGVTKKGLGLEDLKSLEVPLPSLAEQQHIVDEVEWRLSVADDIEKAIEQSQKQAERLRQSILKMAFEGKLVPHDPTDEPASALLERIKASRKRLDEEQRRRKAAQRRQKAKHGKRREVSISTAMELRELLKQLQYQSGSHVPVNELWKSSNLDMDTFQALLREEIQAGRVRERREGYIAFLEAANES